jgi:hypothetical protein
VRAEGRKDEFGGTGRALRRRFPQASPELEKDLADCEEAVTNDKLPPKSALALVQALSRHSELAGRGGAGRDPAHR